MIFKKFAELFFSYTIRVKLSYFAIITQKTGETPHV